MDIKAELCVVCKASRLLCGLEKCPKLEMLDANISTEQKVGREFSGPAPGVFVGKLGWPNVYAGPVGALTDSNEQAAEMDSPSKWFGKDYGSLIRMRSLMVRGKVKENVYSRSKSVSDMQELAMSSRPADTEMFFHKKPTMKVSFSEVSQPMGPSGILERMRITENVHVPNEIENAVSDGLKAAESSSYLYEKGHDVYKITTLFSSGLLGKGDKRMVPTRWSITATDDMVFKAVLGGIKSSPSVNDFIVYHSRFLDNSFTILLMPGSWEYEGFEAWCPGGIWSSDVVIDGNGARMMKSSSPYIIPEYEPFDGRTKYAEGQGGGYYAARLAVAEALRSMGRQARALVFREIYEGYTVPMGVWVVRETARNAMKTSVGRFSTREDALREVSSRLRIPLSSYAKQSKILSQRKLVEF